MAERYNATCSICGRPYYKCISCKDTMALNPWKAFCDTAEHYKVHQIIRGFNGGVYTKDEAKNKLNNININIADIKEFKPHIKEIIENILKEDKPVVEVIEEPIIEEPIVEAVMPETLETNEIMVEKPIYSRKRNNKTDNEVVEAE